MLDTIEKIHEVYPRNIYLLNLIGIIKIDRAGIDIWNLKSRGNLMSSGITFDKQNLSHLPCIGISINNLCMFPDNHNVSRNNTQNTLRSLDSSITLCSTLITNHSTGHLFQCPRSALATGEWAIAQWSRSDTGRVQWQYQKTPWSKRETIGSRARTNGNCNGN